MEKHDFTEIKSVLAVADQLEELASACFTLNQDYCDAITYDYDYKYWEDLERDQQLSYIAAVYILYSKLELLYPEQRKALDNNCIDKLAEEQHTAWVKAKQAEGWSYDAVKDDELKTHPNMVAWKELSYQEKLKDILFVTTVLTHFDRIKDISK